MQQIHRRQPVHERDHAAFGVHRFPQQVQQARERVDRDRASRLDGRFGDEHRERCLPGADVSLDPEPLAAVEVRVDRAHVAADGADLIRGGSRHVADGRALEGDSLVAAGDAAGKAAGVRRRDARRPAGAVPRRVRVRIDDEATAVAGAGRARAAARAGSQVRDLEVLRELLLEEAIPGHCA